MPERGFGTKQILEGCRTCDQSADEGDGLYCEIFLAERKDTDFCILYKDDPAALHYFRIIPRKRGRGKRLIRSKEHYKYIEFELIESKPKTAIYQIINKNHDIIIGKVKWFGTWRQYCFFPEGNTVFSRGCMADIIDFIADLMKSRNVVK